jgi:hypothetical protein
LCVLIIIYSNFEVVTNIYVNGLTSKLDEVLSLIDVIVRYLSIRSIEVIAWNCIGTEG